MKQLFHFGPPLSRIARGKGIVARFVEIPPTLRGGVGGDSGTVGFVFFSVIFEVTEEPPFPMEDGIIADVTGGECSQDLGPDRLVKLFVFVEFFRTNPDDRAEALHKDQTVENA